MRTWKWERKIQADRQAVLCNLGAEAQPSSFQFTSWNSSGGSQVPHVAVMALPAVLVCPPTIHVLLLFWQAAHTFLRKEHIQGKKNNEFNSMELLKNKVCCPLPCDNSTVSKASSPVLCTVIAAQGCQLSLFRNSANGLHYFFKQSSEIRLLNRTRSTSAARDCHMV